MPSGGVLLSLILFRGNDPQKEDTMNKKINFCRKADKVLGCISLIILAFGLCFMDSETLIPMPLVVCLAVGIPTAVGAWFFHKLAIYYRLQERRKTMKKAA